MGRGKRQHVPYEPYNSSDDEYSKNSSRECHDDRQSKSICIINKCIFLNILFFYYNKVEGTRYLFFCAGLLAGLKSCHRIGCDCRC